ncbi:MAG: hypothetical protein OMM_03592 [Candidatus Magnetoglobus multicellularis str. Araruama]|uniref:Uncharacterized protein n=1 Tax=Candidatus Magnetoglobus multicellularis str. Araruama TaxID=890399 RepID=A0A1V1P5B4_9BACT|nr:MAG: hypothetical protein OMM_03592 [Candidatus Magnetoglobus multicellularis str. Araruama]
MPQINRKLYLINDKQTITEISPEFYHEFISNPKSVAFENIKASRMRLAEIHLESDREGPSAIVDAEFRYLYVTDNGSLDESMFAQFIQTGLDAIHTNAINDPFSDYRTRFFWNPTPDEFKTVMSLAINPKISLPCQVRESHVLPIDNSEIEINGIRKMLDAFPGLKAVGTNRSLHFWTVTFDIVSLHGLISLLFLKEGLKHDHAKSASLTLTCPENDMRFVLTCSSLSQTKKVSIWLIYIFQKRLEYKDMKDQSSCQCNHHEDNQ